MFVDTNIIPLGYFGERQNNRGFAAMFTRPVLKAYYVARRLPQNEKNAHLRACIVTA